MLGGMNIQIVFMPQSDPCASKLIAHDYSKIWPKIMLSKKQLIENSLSTLLVNLSPTVDGLGKNIESVNLMDNNFSRKIRIFSIDAIVFSLKI